MKPAISSSKLLCDPGGPGRRKWSAGLLSDRQYFLVLQVREAPGAALAKSLPMAAPQEKESKELESVEENVLHISHSDLMENCSPPGNRPTNNQRAPSHVLRESGEGGAKLLPLSPLPQGALSLGPGCP